MKRFLIGLAFAGAALLGQCGSAFAADGSHSDYRQDRPLPRNFTVYPGGGKVFNWAAPGTHAVTLPTSNPYRGKDGGYVACYAHNEAGSAYGVGGGIYVMGQVRLRGAYEGRIFQPRGYRRQDISALPRFKRICAKHVKACSGGDCWAGGDTGGWFGIP